MVDRLWGFTMSSAQQQNDYAGIGHNSAVAEPDGLLADYFSPKELAAELGIHQRTLARWYSLRIGPPRTTVGRKPLYRRSAVEQWLRNREQEPPKDSPRSRRTPGR
jgi:hypothetical protein